jgi:all-trans-retinol 13,14-reductase
VGIHYIGEVQRPNSIVKRLFDYVSNGALKWEDMGPVYDKIIIGNKGYDLVKGVKNFKAKMLEYFPEESKAIDPYVDFVFLANKRSRNFFMDKTLPPLLSKMIGGFLRRPFYEFYDKTTYDVERGNLWPGPLS